MTIWVDPKTQLPIRMEAGDGQEDRMILSDFAYDRPLDPALFSMKPPEGFQVETFGLAKLPDPPKEKDIAAPEIKPGVGLGPIKFGMPKDEVERILGKPDTEETRGKATSMNYLSRGYGLHVTPQRGVWSIYCYTQEAFAVKARSFQGKSAEGIGMGSSQEQIVKAYGKPDRAEMNGPQTTYLTYNRLNLSFTLFNDKVVQLMMGPNN
jgi:hypothetical protein